MEVNRMKAITLKELKAGEWFTRKPIEEPKESQVFIRRDYCRQDKKYSCERFSDMNSEIFLKGSTVVYTDFIF